MTRDERITVAIVALCVVAFVVALVTGFATSLNGLGWFGGGANLIQWSSGLASFAAVAALVTGYLHRTCAARRWCLRFGEHPVAGTLAKVCSHHHLAVHHREVQRRLGPIHAASGRLGRGQSVGRREHR